MTPDFRLQGPLQVWTLYFIHWSYLCSLFNLTYWSLARAWILIITFPKRNRRIATFPKQILDIYYILGNIWILNIQLTWDRSLFKLGLLKPESMISSLLISPQTCPTIYLYLPSYPENFSCVVVYVLLAIMILIMVPLFSTKIMTYIRKCSSAIIFIDINMYYFHLAIL